jgi:hypothetical protein
MRSSFSRIAYKLPETNFSSDGRSLHYGETTQRSPTYRLYGNEQSFLLTAHWCNPLCFPQVCIDQTKALVASYILYYRTVTELEENTESRWTAMRNGLR